MTLVSTYPNNLYEVFDTIQAAAADLVVADRKVSIGNPLVEICEWPDITAASINVAVTEVSQVTTLTPVAAANSLYAFVISQYNPVTGKNFVQTFTYTTAASGDTATTIGDAFRSYINAATDQGTLGITASGTTTLILTADPGFPLFTVGIYETGGGLTQAPTTPGVAPVGTTASLALLGLTVSGAEYTTIVMEYAPSVGQKIKDPVRLNSKLTVYLNEAATNYSDLYDAFSFMLAAREISAGGPVNPEIFGFVS